MFRDKSVLKVKVIREGVKTPAYGSELASGLDLFCAASHSIQVNGTVPELIPTGIAIELDPDFEAQVRPRSSLCTKMGMWIPNSPGTVDADYRGEIYVPLLALGAPMYIRPGDKFAQLVIAPVQRVQVVTVDRLSSTARGRGGFGSTGRF